MAACRVFTPSRDAEAIFANFMVVWETFDLAASFWVNAQTSVCREVACPLGTASETAREGKHMLSARATSDIVRTWEKEVRNHGFRAISLVTFLFATRK